MEVLCYIPWLFITAVYSACGVSMLTMAEPWDGLWWWGLYVIAISQIFIILPIIKYYE